jgi:hypothetical protein
LEDQKWPQFRAWSLDTIRGGDCADGRPWTRARDSFTTPCDLAAISRSLRGLSVVLDLLHAAERSRHAAEDDEHVGEFVIDGLIVAARQLAPLAQASLGASA